MGKPMATRKIGRAHSAHEVILHAAKTKENVWEVTMQLMKTEMAALARDEGFMQWVVNIA